MTAFVIAALRAATQPSWTPWHAPQVTRPVPRARNSFKTTSEATGQNPLDSSPTSGQHSGPIAQKGRMSPIGTPGKHIDTL